MHADRRAPDTDGDGNGATVRVRAERFQGRSEPFACSRCARNRHASQDDDELFAAVASEQFFGSKETLGRLGDVLQHRVAGWVTVRVVDVFEVIHVEQQDRSVSLVRAPRRRAPRRAARGKNAGCRRG